MPLKNDHAELIRALRRAVGRSAVRDDVAGRVVYARDASHLSLGRPACVVLPETVTGLQRAVAVCARFGRAFVVRGGGTGLSGGALPVEGAVVIGTGRLTGLGAVDPQRGRVHAEPGVVNEVVSRHAAPHRLHFAPDPSSQSAATVGGNVAENAGGPHCLKVGVTSQHVARLDWVDVEGRAWTTGRGGSLERGPSLRGLLCGSEGTLGVVTGAVLELLPVPEAAITLLAVFPRLEDATGAVVDLMGSGVVPEACEIIDQVMLTAVETAFRFGLPTDSAAVMICEVAGDAGAAAADAARAESILRAAGAGEVTAATDEAERDRLWMCRKKAFGAVGRLAPAYISMDVVVPLGSLTTLVNDIQTIKAEHRVEVATALHAGDGNLHPGVHYDERDEDLTARAHRAARAIVMRALELGGSCTGEHGVGLEKRHLVHHQLDTVSLRLMRGIKDLFDPDGRCNPGKVLPDPEVVAGPPPPVPVATGFRWESLTVTAPADTPLASLQAEALARGLWIPVGAASGRRAAGPGLAGAVTVGDLVNAGTSGPALLADLRPCDAILELWAETGDGEVFRAGAPVLKNVAGYDLVRLLVASGGILARPLAATMLLRPAPACVGRWIWPEVPPMFSAESRREFKRLLGRHGQPALVVRERGHDGAALSVLAAGRKRAWDLDRLDDDLNAWSEDHGAGHPRSSRLATADLATPDLLNGLPSWARSGPDWTLLAMREEHPDWPRPRRFIWQRRGDLLWVPAVYGEDPVGWFADNVFRDGGLQPLPRPPAGVPVAILRGLKDLFDPRGQLPSPSWLDEVSK